MASLRDRCPTCGFDPATVPPADAAVAARSFPRRYRGVLVRLDDEDGADVVARRPADGGWSAIEHGAHAAEAMAAAAEALRRTGVEDRPEVMLDPGEPRAGSVDAVLERLEAAASALAAALDRHPSDGWHRPALVRGGDEVTAVDIARQGAHVGAHHLRAAQQAVDQARRQH
jgi:hypothetical protein